MEAFIRLELAESAVLALSLGGELRKRSGDRMSTAEDRARDLPEQDRVVDPDRVVDMEERKSATLSPVVQNAISRGLQEFYGSMLEDPMPEKFSRLLASLGRAENKDER